jgi:hypothetical protein
MLAAMGSGMALLFAILVPGAYALFSTGGGPTLALAAWVGLFSLGVAVLARHWVRTGFDRLFQELPF